MRGALAGPGAHHPRRADEREGGRIGQQRGEKNPDGEDHVAGPPRQHGRPARTVRTGLPHERESHEVAPPLRGATRECIGAEGADS